MQSLRSHRHTYVRANVYTRVHTHTHTHIYTTPDLSYQPSTTGLITTIYAQRRAMWTTAPFTVSVCEFSLSFFCCPPLSLLFPTMHQEDYQLQLIYKLSDALAAQIHTVAGWNKNSCLLKEKWKLIFLSRCSQRNNSAVFMERAWSAMETCVSFWIWWGVEIRPAAIWYKERCWSDQTAANMKRTAISSQHLRQCKMNTASLVSLSQPPLGLETFFHNCI